MTGGNAFFLKEARDLHREVEGFCPPDEEPRLGDPPAPAKTCGECEWYEKCGSMTGLCRRPGGDGEAVFADDEACGGWRGEEGES